MKKGYEVSREEAVGIREKMKESMKKASYRRLEVVALLGEGRSPSEVAQITKYNEKHVRELGNRYRKEGLDALARDGRVGGNHCVMSKEKSEEFLRQFEKRAQNGQMITIEEIAAKLDEATGKKRESLSTAYYFLHRNDWRKVMPRSRHPKKANEEEILIAKNKIKSGSNTL